MPRVIDMLSTDEIKTAYGNAEDALLRIGVWREERGSADSQRYIIPGPNEWEDSVEVGEQLLRYVHSEMMARAERVTTLNKPYTHQARIMLTDIVQNMGQGTMSKDQVRHVAHQVSVLLRMNKLAIRAGQGRSSLWWLQPWPSGMTLKIAGWSTVRISKTDERHIARRVAEETKPITRSFDPTAIPFPEPTPESVLEYVKKLLACTKGLKKLQEETTAELVLTRKQRDEFKNRLINMGGEGWSALVEQIEKEVATS